MCLRRKWGGIVFAILCSSMGVFSNEMSERVSLSWAIQCAINHSNEIELANTRFNMAKSDRWGALGEYLPSITASWQRGTQKNSIDDVDSQSTSQNVKQVLVDQPIFNGFYSIYRMRSTKYGVMAADADRTQTTLDVVGAVVEAFLNLYTSQKQLAIQEETVMVAKDILDRASEQLELQTISKNDWIQYESNYLKRQADYLDAKKAQYQAMVVYQSLVGANHHQLNEPTWPTTLFNIQEASNMAMARNPGIQMAYYQKEKAQSDWSISKGRLLPKATFVASFKRQADALYMDDKDIDTQQYYVDISVPLFQKGQRAAQVKKSYHQFKQHQMAYELEQERVLRELKSTIERYHFNHDLVASYWELQKTAQKKLARLKEQRTYGTVDTLAVLTARQDLNSLHVRAYALRSELFLAYYKIQLLSGQTDWYAPKHG